MVDGAFEGGARATPLTGRDRIGEFLALLAMCGIAIAEPVLTAFRDGASVFILRRADGLDVVAFTVVVVFGPALALWALLQLFGLVLPSRRELLRGSLIGLLGALVVMRVLYQLGDPPRLVVVLAALVVGAGVAFALQRWSAVGSWMQLLAVFPVLLGVVFVTTEPVSNLVFASDGGGVGAASVGSPDPLVVLVLDELPTASLLDDNNEISAEQFPNLADFAGQATWYRNHSSIAPSTPQAVPAILSGRLPTSLDALPSAEEHPDNLFTLLRGAYRMNVQEGATRLCPADLCNRADDGRQPVNALLSDATALWADQLAASEQDRQGDFQVRQSDPSAPATFNDFLRGIEADDGPILDFHHALYPHQPWFHLPSGLTYEAPFVAEGLDGAANYSWTGVSAAASGRQRHLLQAKHADALVGQLVARLRQLDRYDESLIVITADHGVAFTDGEPVRGLAAGNAEQVMWTPLLIKTPAQAAPEIDERPAQAIDVLATVADHLDIELPFETDGRSLLGDTPNDNDERVFFEWGLNRLLPGEDGLVRIDGTDGYRDLLALPAPGVGDDPDLRFFRFGEYADLVGQRLDALVLGEPLSGEATLDQASNLVNVATDASPVPAYLSGDLPGDSAVDVAIAVNGTIGGWARTEPAEDSGRQRFWSLVPPELLVDGSNEATVFVIESDPANSSEPVLRPIPLPR